jgi:hypothetical protein
MVGEKGKKNQTIRPDFEANLGRYGGGTSHSKFDMSGQGVGNQQAAGAIWLQLDTSYWGETNRRGV